MTYRKIEKSENYLSNLKTLLRKFPGIDKSVNDALEEYAANGPSHDSQKIPGLGGRPIYKSRIPLKSQGTGKRKGARLIYYCDNFYVRALCLYVKGSHENIPNKTIIAALNKHKL